MAWPNPFLKRDENTRSAWGYTFQLSSSHLTVEHMKPMKHSYDTLGEQALNKLNQISPPLHSALPRNAARYGLKATAIESGTTQEPYNPQRDLYTLLKQNADEDETLGKLWTEVTTVPPWVDWDQIARGQECFYRYGGPALTGLAFQSLLGGMGAARVVETLARTGSQLNGIFLRLWPIY